MHRKFFTFVFTLNAVGIGFAASGHWPYAVEFSGAMVLGNLFVAILVRNELFGRFLYLFVNTLFAKVSLIVIMSCSSLTLYPVDSSLVETGLHVCSSGKGLLTFHVRHRRLIAHCISALGRYPHRMRNLRYYVADLQGRPHV